MKTVLNTHNTVYPIESSYIKVVLRDKQYLEFLPSCQINWHQIITLKTLFYFIKNKIKYSIINKSDKIKYLTFLPGLRNELCLYTESLKWKH